MSLYDGVGGPSGGKKNWEDVGFKMLQSQIAKKKAQASAAVKERKAAASGAPGVVDMSAIERAKKLAEESKPKPFLLKPRKAFAMDQMPLSFLPTAIKADATIIFGDYTIEDEYDPMIPNDYTICAVEKDAEIKREADEARRKVIEERRRRMLERPESPEIDERKEMEAEAKKRKMGAAIAPPQALVQQDQKRLAEPEPVAFLPNFGGASKGLTTAARMMEKMGYKAGAGLGAKGQGMTTALRVENRGGTNKIVHENMAGVAPEPAVKVVGEEEPLSTVELLRNPTKVVLLTNMVGRGEVDADLEPEVRDEMSKFGDVVNVVVKQMDEDVPEIEAVRIFVTFATQEHAIKSVVALNGRFFGGRQVRTVFYDEQKLEEGVLTD